MDREIIRLAEGGVYRTADHLARLQQGAARGSQSTVEAYVRRLEALRRAGAVERVADGVWKVPPDFLSRAREYDTQKAAGITIELRSLLPLDQQVGTVGATWLDRQLVTDGRNMSRQGFGAQVCEALHNRAAFLVEQGLGERRGQSIVFARNLLATLRDRELASVGKALQEHTGQIYREVRNGEHASGIYRRSVQLASGRFAVLDDGKGFSFVPWRPVLEHRLGQQVAAIVQGNSVTWRLGKNLGLAT